MRRHNRKPDKKRRAWIQRLFCVACLIQQYGLDWKVVAFDEQPSVVSQSHHSGVRGLGQRAAEDKQVPLCFRHHDRGSPVSVHVDRQFWDRLGVTADVVISEYRKAYEFYREAA